MPLLQRLAVFLFALFLTSCSLAQVPTRQPGSASANNSGDPAPGPATDILANEHSATDMLEIVPFASKIFGNRRMLRIHLPGNYFSPRNRTRHYPVLYLQDGQNVFEKATSSTHMEWQADEAVDRLVGSFQIPPIFIVAIDNAASQRTSEYLAYPDLDNPQFQGGQSLDLRATEYADFLIKEVMPYIEKHYRVATGVANTAIGGSQYGADVSLLTVLNHPGVFGKLLLESPALGIGNRQLLKDVEKTPASKLPSKIYLGVGTKEFSDPARASKTVLQVQELAGLLHAKGLDPTRLKLSVGEGAPADESAWAQRFPDALLFFYGPHSLGSCR